MEMEEKPKGIPRNFWKGVRRLAFWSLTCLVIIGLMEGCFVSIQNDFQQRREELNVAASTVLHLCTNAHDRTEDVLGCMEIAGYTFQYDGSEVLIPDLVAKGE